MHDQVVGLVSVCEKHVTGIYSAFAAISAQYSKLGRIQDWRTPRKRDQPIVTAAWSSHGISRTSAVQAGGVHAHRNLLADKRDVLTQMVGVRLANRDDPPQRSCGDQQATAGCSDWAFQAGFLSRFHFINH
jgi:hypothetical protein